MRPLLEWKTVDRAGDLFLYCVFVEKFQILIKENVQGEPKKINVHTEGILQ